MQIKNSMDRFGAIAIFFHWFMAILVITMLAVGLYMVDLPADSEKTTIYGLHKATGILILMLVTLRILWRFANTTPALLIPTLEKIAARTVHWALYGCMFAMPITGWLLSSAAGYPPSFYGLFEVPALMAPNPAWVPVFATMHKWIAYGLIIMIIIHTAAALKHHFIDKDTILRRMLP